jgi:hypothetical protein
MCPPGRWSGGREACPICKTRTSDACGFEYHDHLCFTCVKSGVLEKLDDILIYFITNKNPTWRERFKFNMIERLAYDRYRKIVTRRVENIKRIRAIKDIPKIDLKYTEEKRILERDW